MTSLEPLSPNLTIPELESKASSGHVIAQYALAKISLARGEYTKAITWYNKAADARFPPAAYELGMMHLLGHHVDVDIKKALALISSAAEQKSCDAIRLCAVLGATGILPGSSWAVAVDYLLEAANMVDPHALRQIGFLLQTRNGDAALAETMLKAAASLNEPIALKMVGPQKNVSAEILIPEKWAAWSSVRAFLLELDDNKHRQPVMLSGKPTVTQYSALLSSDECMYLREIARPSLTSNVQLLGGNPKDPGYQRHQTNRVMIFYPVVQDLVIYLLTQRLVRHSGLPSSHAEMLIIQQTRQNEEFSVHADYLDPTDPYQAYSIQQSGQRIKSLFCYLNDDYEGGETVFPESDLKIKGKCGDAVVLENVNSIGLPEEKSRHAGLPVKKGEKWLASIWFRDKSIN